MKVTIQFVTLFLFVQLAIAAKGPVANAVCDEVCLDTFPVEDNYNIPYKNDCTKFCQCANDGNWEINCPEGLHFNSKLQVCDWPQAAGCENGSLSTDEPNNEHTPDTTEEAQEPSEEVTTASSTNPGNSNNLCGAVCANVFPTTTHNNYLPYPDECNKFCHCADDGNYVNDCPVGLQFNAVLQVCDLPESAGCDASITTPQAPSTSTPLSFGCENVVCGNNDCFEVSNTDECQAYCNCDRGEIIVKQCAEGLHFNNMTHLCDFPENAKCAVPLPPNGCEHVKCNGDDCIKTDNSLDCNQYCNCDHGNMTIGHCASGLYFNSATGTCDFPWNANCEVTKEPNNEQPTPPTKPSLLCDNICSNGWPIDKNNHLPFPKDCTKFCHCANDGNWLKDCPPRLHFNAKLQVCDWPRNAECQ